MYRARSVEKSPSLARTTRKRPKQAELAVQHHTREGRNRSFTSPSPQKSSTSFSSPRPQPPAFTPSSSSSSSSSSSWPSPATVDTHVYTIQVSQVDEDESSLSRANNLHKSRNNMISLQALLNGVENGIEKDIEVRTQRKNYASSSFRRDVVSAIVDTHNRPTVEVPPTTHILPMHVVYTTNRSVNTNDEKNLQNSSVIVTKCSSISSGSVDGTNVGNSQIGMNDEFEVQLQDSSSDDDDDDDDNSDQDCDDYINNNDDTNDYNDDNNKTVAKEVASGTKNENLSNQHNVIAENTNTADHVNARMFEPHMVTSAASLSPKSAYISRRRVIQDDDDEDADNDNGSNQENVSHQNISDSTYCTSKHNEMKLIDNTHQSCIQDKFDDYNDDSNKDQEELFFDTPINSQSEPILEAGQWKCSYCTFINDDHTASYCKICIQKRIVTRAKRLLPQRGGKENIVQSMLGGSSCHRNGDDIVIRSDEEKKDDKLVVGHVHTRKKAKKLEDSSITMLDKLPVATKKPIPKDTMLSSSSSRHATKLFEASGEEISRIDHFKRSDQGNESVPINDVDDNYHNDIGVYDDDRNDYDGYNDDNFRDGLRGQLHESTKSIETEKFDFTSDIIRRNEGNQERIKKDVNFKLQFATASECDQNCSRDNLTMKSNCHYSHKDNDNNILLMSIDDSNDDDFMYTKSRKEDYHTEDVTRGVFKHFKSIAELKRTGECHINFKDFVLQTKASTKPIDLRQDQRREQREKVQQKKKSSTSKAKKSSGKKWFGAKKYYRRKSK